jgi:hypothetical protein
VEPGREAQRRVPAVFAVDELVDERLVGEPPPERVVERRASGRRPDLVEEDRALL